MELRVISALDLSVVRLVANPMSLLSSKGSR
jgi:hypothetical protein